MNLAKRKNGIYYVQYFDVEENRVRRFSTGKRNKKEALKFLTEFHVHIKNKLQVKYLSLASFRDE